MSGNVSNPFFLKTYLNLLSRLREGGATFAKQNPEIAPYLDMTNRKSADPEIERLIESFAFITAQVEYKSLLSQNEYLIQFIENILPEITQPIPSLAMIKCNVNEKMFADKQPEAILNAQTLLSFTHSDGQSFYFSSPADYTLYPFKISQTTLATSTSSKENLYHHKRAVLFNLDAFFPINQNKNKKIKIRFYIDSDVNNTLNMLDAFFSSKKNIIVINDEGEKFELSRKNLKIPFEFDNYTQQNNNSNCLYPLFDFCKFYNKYYFLEIELPEFISFSKTLKVIIPLDDTSPYKFEIKENTFLINCLPFFNYYKKNLKPIRTQTGVYEYEVHDDFLKSFANQIITINNVSTIHPITNESQEIVYYHKKSLANVNDKHINQNCYWVARRSYYAETEQNGVLLLRLILTDETVHLPDYLKINAFCTNGKDVTKILPKSQLTVENSNIQFTSETLSWIEAQENITDIIEKIDTISYLFLLTKKFCLIILTTLKIFYVHLKFYRQHTTRCILSFKEH